MGPGLNSDVYIRDRPDTHTHIHTHVHTPAPCLLSHDALCHLGVSASKRPWEAMSRCSPDFTPPEPRALTPSVLITLQSRHCVLGDRKQANGFRITGTRLQPSCACLLAAPSSPGVHVGAMLAIVSSHAARVRGHCRGSQYLHMNAGVQELKYGSAAAGSKSVDQLVPVAIAAISLWRVMKQCSQ
jgi:hypothetical protein